MYYRRNTRDYELVDYTLLLVYVDNVLACSRNPGKVMEKIGMRCKMKNNKYGPLNVYL